ncbi:MAG: hypothetical protein WD826_03245 [Actinomycetota bacterium]
MRQVTVDCDVCGMRMLLEQGKEVLITQGNNKFHLLDLCARCLDDLLRDAATVNDANGFRQQAAAMITLRSGEIPQRRVAAT